MHVGIYEIGIRHPAFTSRLVAMLASLLAERQEADGLLRQMLDDWPPSLSMSDRIRAYLARRGE